MIAVTSRITHTVQCINGTTGSISLGGVAYDVTSENCDVYDVSVAANQTNKQVNLAFAYATLAAIIIVVSADMTLETNDGTTPDDDFALKAGKPFVWDKDSGIPNPFTADVDEIYLTNTTAGTLQAFVFKGDVSP